MTHAQAYQFKYPPQQQLCLKHRFATRIWKGIYDENDNYQVCNCCGRKVGQQQVPHHCCYQSSQLEFLGVGVPLFFSYLRYSILLLVLLALIFCIFGLYTNISSGNCDSDNNCKPNIFNTLSIINKRNDSSFMSVQNYILLAFVVLTIFIFQFFRYRFRKIVEEIDQFYSSPSDYSIILQRLPQQTTKRDIQEMIYAESQFLSQPQKIATNNLKIENVIMSYDLNQYNQAKQWYLKKFKQTIKKTKIVDQRPQLPKPTVPAYIAIVVFQRKFSKELLIHEHKCTQKSLHYFFSPCAPLSDFRIQGQRISVQRAPQPDDILWNNADTTVASGIIRKFLLGVVSFILLIAGGAAQYGLALLQKQVTDSTQKILIGFAASIVVTITNSILQLFLIYSNFWQRMNTMTQYADVLNFKLVFQQFLNAGIFVVGANILANYQTFNLQTSLSQTITQIMLLNAILQNVQTFVLYKFDIVGRVCRYFCLKKQWKIYTQLQANQLYTLPIPSLPSKYSYIIKTVWLTAFYAPFVPIVVPLSIVGLIFNYGVQKYLFGSAYSAPSMISTALNNSCIQLFEYVPLILSLGQFVIYFYFQKFNFNLVPLNWSIPIFISIGLSVVQLLLPMHKLNKVLFEMNIDLTTQPTYQQAKGSFQVTYELTNPAYQDKRPRLRDVYIWKKLFGHAPSQVNVLNQQNINFNQNFNQNYSTESNRSYMTPFLNQQFQF